MLIELSFMREAASWATCIPCRRTLSPCSGSGEACGPSRTRVSGASIDRMSFTVSRGTVISSILPERARQSRRPGKPYGAALLIKLLNSSCSRCSIAGDHSDHFLLHINTGLPSLSGYGVLRSSRGRPSRPSVTGFPELAAYVRLTPGAVQPKLEIKIRGPDEP